MATNPSEIAVHRLPIDVAEGVADAVLEVPRGDVRGLVLLGHGLSAHRRSKYLLHIASHLHSLSIATISMDAPLHGTRRERSTAASFDEWVAQWQAFWGSGGSAQMTAEYKAMLDHCPRELSSLPIGYWGSSLATQTGIPWLAQDPRPVAAVLGQFRGDGLLMRRFAPQIAIPVFFIQQQDDQLHSAEVSKLLFDQIGSNEKILRSSPGDHGAVPIDVLDESVIWLSDTLARTPH